MKTIPKLLSLLFCLALLAGVRPAASAAPEGGVRPLSSGELEEEYYIPTSGTPISGADQVVFDGARFFTAETTAERRLVGRWFTAEGVGTEQSLLIVDLSGTTGNLSQPSLCVLNGEIYVGWVVIADEAQNDAGGAQYLAKIRADGTLSGPVCIRSDCVWPRRPALCAGEDGVLLVYRVYEESYDYDYGYEWWAHTCYATFVTPELEFTAPYRLNRGNHAIYPSAAYSPASKRFLVVWDHGSVMGALVTKDTADTPENLQLIFFQNRSTQRPMVASDGKDFLVTCDLVRSEGYYDDDGHSFRGLWAVKVGADGSVGTPVHTVQMQGERDSLNSGQVRWDGDGWLIGYSCERDEQLRWDVGSELVDFRLTDCFIRRLNAVTLRPEGPPVGVGTGWWHQSHPRFALAPNGAVFCTYLEDRGGGTRLRWFCFEGRGASAAAEAAESGHTLQRQQLEGVYSVGGGDGNGRTAWLIAGCDHRWNGTAWEANESFTYPDKTFDTFAGGDGFYIAAWSGSVLRVAPGASAAEDRLEFAADFGECGDGPCCGVWADRDGTLWVAAADGTIWSKPRGAGRAAKRFDLGAVGCDFHSIHGSGPADIYAVGDRGLLVHWDGAAWSRIETPVCAALNGVRADGAGAWVVGDGGVVLRVENGVCTRVASPTESDLYDIWSLSAERFFVCGLGDGVWYWQNGAWYRLAIDRSDPENEYAPAAFGALTDVFGVAEGESLRLFVLSVAEENGGVYTVTLPLLASERPSGAHVPGEPTEENRVEPGCTEAGSYERVVRCRDCGAELSRETVTLPPLGHDWGPWSAFSEPTCVYDGVAIHTCSRCFASETGPIPARGHDWTEWSVTREPAFDAEGEETRRCRLCGETETRPIPKREPIPGDLNANGVLDAEDAVLLFRAVSSGRADPQTMDLTGDGRADDRDALLLFRRVSQ